MEASDSARDPELVKLVERLWEARQKGDYCPEWLNGALALDRALAVQLGLLERKVAAGDALAGWKIGLTSERARGALGVDARPFGHLHERLVAACIGLWGRLRARFGPRFAPLLPQRLTNRLD